MQCMQVDEPGPTKQNLYQIPQCTICLAELSEDMASLACGHVFHINCITQNFQYRGTCPNCQKRATSKEIRLVRFNLVKNNESAYLMRQLLGDMSKSEKSQMESLFAEFQDATQKNQRFKDQITEFEKQEKKMKKEIDNLTTAVNQGKIHAASLRKQAADIQKVLEYFQVENKHLKQQDFERGIKMQEYRERQDKYQHMQKMKKMMNSSTGDLIKYKNELEASNTPPSEMVKQFYDMVRLRSVELSNLKNKLNTSFQKISEGESAITKLKWSNENYKKQARQNQERYQSEKKAHDELRLKYRHTVDKYKKLYRSVNQYDDEDSVFSKGHHSFPVSGGFNGNANVSINGNEFEEGQGEEVKEEGNLNSFINFSNLNSSNNNNNNFNNSTDSLEGNEVKLERSEKARSEKSQKQRERQKSIRSFLTGERKTSSALSKGGGKQSLRAYGGIRGVKKPALNERSSSINFMS